MADALSLLLWSLAEYFNYTAVALVILCSTLMTVFIIRLNGDHWGNYRNGMQSRASLAHQKDVEQFVNPFFLTLDPVVTSTLSDGVSLQLSCLQPSVVRVFWGATINPVHAALLKQGREFVDDVNSDTLLLDQYLTCRTHSFEEEGKHNLHLTVPEEVSAESLGCLPRQRYPCVIVMTVKDRPSIEDHTSLVATVTILHVKDSECRMQTHILAQYAKMAGHAVFNLQPLFFASSMDEDNYTVDGQGSHSTEQCHSNQQTPSSNADDSLNPQTQPEAEETEPSSFSETANSVSANASQCENETGRPSTTEAPSSGSFARKTGQSSSPSEREGACRDCDRDVHSLYSSVQERELSNETMFPECIVCQNQPLNCVLLPCRHTCVCSTCFQKLDRCPMCRSHVESFFHLRDDDADEVPVLSEEEHAVPRDLYSMFERWNTRLNQYLGFE